MPCVIVWAQHMVGLCVPFFWGAQHMVGLYVPCVIVWAMCAMCYSLGLTHRWALCVMCYRLGLTHRWALCVMCHCLGLAHSWAFLLPVIVWARHVGFIVMFFLLAWCIDGLFFFQELGLFMCMCALHIPALFRYVYRYVLGVQSYIFMSDYAAFYKFQHFFLFYVKGMCSRPEGQTWSCGQPSECCGRCQW